MRVQHNIISMNSYRNYNNNTSQINRNIEKLSSGYKINRAGDDAAGLAISEKMRAQITGLQTAQKNAKDGISLVQTAEGALTEVHSMLNRMYQLAEQSANGTYDETTDRAQLQKEVSSLRTEINRISDSANFNGIKLLDGSMSRVSVDWSSANTDDQLKSYVGFSILAESKEDLQAFADTFGGNDPTNPLSFNVTLDAVSDGSLSGSTLTFDNFKDASLANYGTDDGAGNKSGYEVSVTDSSGNKIDVADGVITFGDQEGQLAADGDRKLTFKLTDATSKKEIARVSYRFDLDTTTDANKNATNVTSALELKSHDGLNLQIGDDASSWNKMNLNINDIHAESLGIANVDISEQNSAQTAMDAIKDAINYVSDVRGGLGATQNRLDHTINNLSVMEQNIQDAESTIRDTDVADEMMKYTKNSILVQSAQAMLAQANQQPQGVLQLLQ